MKVKCPNCRKEVVWENNAYRPFCSERCKLIDLGLWLDEKYKLESDETVCLDAKTEIDANES